MSEFKETAHRFTQLKKRSGTVADDLKETDRRAEWLVKPITKFVTVFLRSIHGANSLVGNDKTLRIPLDLNNKDAITDFLVSWFVKIVDKAYQDFLDQLKSNSEHEEG